MPTREETIRDHRERLNRVLLYIQDNIDSTLSLDTLAGVACFSPFHFHRIFASYAGETLNEHVRRIRLERAAVKLCHSDESVTSVALTAGYETPAAFTKAFRTHFGVIPSEFKQTRPESYSAVRQNRSNINEEEGKPMQAEIRDVKEQKVLFVRKTGRYEKAATEAWSALMGFAYSRRLMGKETKAIGICYDDPDITPEEKIRYDACITAGKDAKPEGEVGVQTISGGRYAVFLHKGPHEELKKTYRAIFSEWLPASGKRLRDVPCFEIYLNRDPRRTKPENLRTEIYIPVE